MFPRRMGPGLKPEMGSHKGIAGGLSVASCFRSWSFCVAIDPRMAAFRRFPYCTPRRALALSVGHPSPTKGVGHACFPVCLRVVIELSLPSCVGFVPKRASVTVGSSSA